MFFKACAAATSSTYYTIYGCTYACTLSAAHMQPGLGGSRRRRRRRWRRTNSAENRENNIFFLFYQKINTLNSELWDVKIRYEIITEVG